MAACRTAFAATLDVTPLHAAVYGGHKDIVQKLIQSGANPQLIDGYGSTSLDWAVGHNPLCQVMGIWDQNFSATPQPVQ
jgi:ankyrin repeat protein